MLDGAIAEVSLWMSESWQVCAFWYAFLFPIQGGVYNKWVYSLLLSLLFLQALSHSTLMASNEKTHWWPAPDQFAHTYLNPWHRLQWVSNWLHLLPTLQWVTDSESRECVISLIPLTKSKSQVHCSGFPSTLNGQLTIMGAWQVTAVVSAGRKGGVGLWAPCEPSQG